MSASRPDEENPITAIIIRPGVSLSELNNKRYRTRCQAPFLSLH
jgi:hypothetical protein